MDEVTTADVLRILSPIWSTKHETARRLRHRVSAVMKWAVAEGHRGDNPAGDAIGAALPRGSGRVEHHKAQPHAEALEKVQASEAALATKLCICFLVLTACRSGEVRGARWNEIDLEAAVWTIPGDRTKTGKPHRVPLSSAALGVLAERALGHIVRGAEGAYARSDLLERRREIMEGWGHYLS